jgi:hypothetical protein
MVRKDLWYYHPNQEMFPVMVNESGTHLRYTENKKFKNAANNNKFINIRRHKSKFTDWVNYYVSVNGFSKLFSRVACECFIGTELGDQTCEHLNQDRDDNSRQNLCSRGMLFQANNKKCHRPRDDGTHCGVLRNEKNYYYRVTWRCYTTDGGYSASLTKKQNFYDCNFGYNREECYEAAVAFRKQRHLYKGMNREPPVDNGRGIRIRNIDSSSSSDDSSSSSSSFLSDDSGDEEQDHNTPPNDDVLPDSVLSVWKHNVSMATGSSVEYEMQSDVVAVAVAAGVPPPLTPRSSGITTVAIVGTELLNDDDEHLLAKKRSAVMPSKKSQLSSSAFITEPDHHHHARKRAKLYFDTATSTRKTAAKVAAIRTPYDMSPQPSLAAVDTTYTPQQSLLEVCAQHGRFSSDDIVSSVSQPLTTVDANNHTYRNFASFPPALFTTNNTGKQAEIDSQPNNHGSSNVPNPPIVHQKPNYPHGGYKLSWQQSYENLKVYNEMYGNCDVSTMGDKHNFKLGCWVVRIQQWLFLYSVRGDMI